MMDFMSAFFVLVAQHHALLIGGILKSISVQQSLCKHTDGLLIQEMNTLMKDSKLLEVIQNFLNVFQLEFALLLAQRDLIQEKHWKT